MTSSQSDLQIPILLIGTGISANVFAANLDSTLRDRCLAIESGLRTHHLARVRKGPGYMKHGDPMRYRAFGFGGTSRIWGGNLVPFRDEDFDIAKTGSEQWNYLGRGARELAPQALEALGFTKSRKVWKRFIEEERRKREISFSLMINRRLGPIKFVQSNFPLRVIEGLTAMEIQSKGNGYLVKCRNASKKLVTIDAELVVIATGTIEAFRILSLSNKLDLGPSLGSFYSPHLAGSAGFCIIPRGVIENLKDEHEEGLALTLRPFLSFTTGSDARPWKVTFLDLRHNIFAWLENPWTLAKALTWRILHPFDNRVACLVNFDGDQEPNPDSKLVMKKGVVCIEHRVTDGDLSSLSALSLKISSWTESLGGEYVASRFHLMGKSHHLGGLRVGDTDRDSVVNGDLELHNHQGIFNLTAGAFRSFGCANPTFLLSQLAVRLAHRISEIQK